MGEKLKELVWGGSECKQNYLDWLILEQQRFEIGGRGDLLTLFECFFHQLFVSQFVCLPAVWVWVNNFVICCEMYLFGVLCSCPVHLVMITLFGTLISMQSFISSEWRNKKLSTRSSITYLVGEESSMNSDQTRDRFVDLFDRSRERIQWHQKHWFTNTQRGNCSIIALVWR